MALENLIFCVIAWWLLTIIPPEFLFPFLDDDEY